MKLYLNPSREDSSKRVSTTPIVQVERKENA
jgi:hypothetical protein